MALFFEKVSGSLEKKDFTTLFLKIRHCEYIWPKKLGAGRGSKNR
jgi:hypothetical protein